MRCEQGGQCAWCCSNVWQPAAHHLLLWHTDVTQAKSLHFKRDAFIERDLSCGLFCPFTLTHLFHFSLVYLAWRLSVTDKLLSSKVMYEHISFIPFLGLLKSIVAKLDATYIMFGRTIVVNMNVQVAPLRLGNCKPPRAMQRLLWRNEQLTGNKRPNSQVTGIFSPAFKPALQCWHTGNQTEPPCKTVLVSEKKTAHEKVCSWSTWKITEQFAWKL